MTSRNLQNFGRRSVGANQDSWMCDAYLRRPRLWECVRGVCRRTACVPDSSVTRWREGERECEESELPVLCRLPSAAVSIPECAKGGRLLRDGTGEWAWLESATLFRLLSEAERGSERDDVRVSPPVTRRRFV